jgi:hypothetical protein
METVIEQRDGREAAPAVVVDAVDEQQVAGQVVEHVLAVRAAADLAGRAARPRLRGVASRRSAEIVTSFAY